MSETGVRRPLLLVALTKARETGLKESFRLGVGIARAKVNRLIGRRRRFFVFLSPPLSQSGAPLLLTEIVYEFATRFGPDSVRLLAPYSIAPPLELLRTAGVRLERAAEILGPRLVRLQLALKKNDFVLMNTAAVSRNYLDVIMDALERGRLAHAYWYIHEDVEHLPFLAPLVLEAGRRSAIARLMAQRRLTILVPSKDVKASYDELFGNPTTRVLQFKQTAEEVAPRPADDFSSVRFLMSGKPTDGNKGHIIALAAFHELMKAHYELDPDAYRPFTLTLLGMTEDYVAQQIRSIGSTVLGERLHAIAPVPHEQALEITRDCNAVICCSFHETGPLYVTEAMRYGHIVLRSDAGGLEEQLDDGVNGFCIDSTDIRQFAQVLAQVLSKRTMSNSRLHEMGRASQELVARMLIPSYIEALDEARVPTTIA
jgi:glycosyltransferase involved in cell wall biosynthesis